MTLLLKADDDTGQAAVRLFDSRFSQRSGEDIALDQASPTDSDTAQDEHSRLSKQVVHLQGEIEQLRAELAEAKSDAAQREKQSLERGRELGIKEVSANDAERFALLEESLADAQDKFIERQSEIKVLSLNIARTSLRQILGNVDNYENMIGEIVARQLARLRGQLVLAITVSSLDFPDATKLDLLKKRFPDFSIEAVPDLSRGECQMSLKLGKLDIGIPGQSEKMQRLLEKLCDEAMTGS